MLTYTPDFFPSSVLLIGAGGTGSRLMPVLAQLVRSSLKEFNPLSWLVSLPIYVFDGDKVEDKNLVRQNFIPQDVGQNKATVVARRYATGFRIPIHGVPSFFSGKSLNAIESFTTYTGETVDTSIAFARPLIILAVDSPQARREILSTLTRFLYFARDPSPSSRSIFVIDAGNEDDFGQVKFWTGHTLTAYEDVTKKLSARFPTQLPCSKTVHFIPYDDAYYRNLGTSSDEKSCADLPQTLAINNMMSAMILMVAQQFIQMRPMKYDGIRFSLTGGMSLEYNTPQRWMERVGRGTTRFHEILPTRNLDVFEEYLAEVKETYKTVGMRVGSDGSLIPIPSAMPAAKPVVLEVPAGDVKIPELQTLPSPPVTISELAAPPAAPPAPSAAPEVPEASVPFAATIAPPGRVRRRRPVGGTPLGGII